MTEAEKSAWAAAATDAERAAFVETFWRARDLEDNHSFRPDFERRVAFADANFAQDEKRGSMTDRGMVFVLIGPPTYGGRKRLEFSHDTNSNRGMSQVGTYDAYIAEKQAVGQAAKTGTKVTAEQMSKIDDSYMGPGKEAADNEMNYQEVWHYRHDLLPKGVSYVQVDAVFVTKKGYGKNVLQRDSDILTTLNAAKQKPQ
jgi:GWxTD domain-containing protein